MVDSTSAAWSRSSGTDCCCPILAPGRQTSADFPLCTSQLLKEHRFPTVTETTTVRLESEKSKILEPWPYLSGGLRWKHTAGIMRSERDWCTVHLIWSAVHGERGEEGRHTQGQYERHFCDCVTLNNIHASVYQTHTFVLGGVNNITDANFIISLSRDVQQFTFCISDVCAFVVSLGQQVHLWQLQQNVVEAHSTGAPFEHSIRKMR